MPEFRPAKKWTAYSLVPAIPLVPCNSNYAQSSFCTYNKTTSAFRHLTLPRRQLFDCYIKRFETAIRIMVTALEDRP
jgi:hypothetical protein